VSDPSRLLAFLDAPKAPRSRLCWRCESMTDEARAMSLPPPTVREVESWVYQSVRYFSTLCRECADWEWSADWNAQYERAAGNPAEQERLERARGERTSAGRKFWTEARLQRAAKR
jgi:hypothetical protein